MSNFVIAGDNLILDGEPVLNVPNLSALIRTDGGTHYDVHLRFKNLSSVPMISPVFDLGTVTCDQPAEGTGNIVHFDANYIAVVGQDNVFWPSQQMPVGATVLGSGDLWFSAWSPGEGSYLIQAKTAPGATANPLGNTVTLELRTSRTILPGASVDAVIRVTRDPSNDTLLSGWKNCLPPRAFNPSPKKPVARANMATNGLGWADQRNLSDPAQRTSYVARVVAMLKKIGGKGIYMWTPGGPVWTGSGYPQDTVANLRMLDPVVWSHIISEFNAAGIEVGICARGDDADPAQPKFLDQLRYLLATGVGGFYCDSMGQSPSTVGGLAAARKLVGPDPAMLQEHPTDVGGLLGDFYCELYGGPTSFALANMSTFNFAAIKYLAPDAGWFAFDNTGLATAQTYQAMGLIPMIFDGAAWMGLPESVGGGAQ